MLMLDKMRYDYVSNLKSFSSTLLIWINFVLSRNETYKWRSIKMNFVLMTLDFVVRSLYLVFLGKRYVNFKINTICCISLQNAPCKISITYTIMILDTTQKKQGRWMPSILTDALYNFVFIVIMYEV